MKAIVGGVLGYMSLAPIACARVPKQTATYGKRLGVGTTLWRRWFHRVQGRGSGTPPVCTLSRSGPAPAARSIHPRINWAGRQLPRLEDISRSSMRSAVTDG